MLITASQQPVFASIKENLECLIDVLDTHPDSDWILTPEGSLSGYCANVCHEGTAEQKAEYFTALTTLETYLQQNKRSMALGTGHYEQDEFPYNQVRYYREGQLVGAYNKQRLTRTTNGLGEHYCYMMGLESSLIELSGTGPRTGTLICNDAWAMPTASPLGDSYLFNEIAGEGACCVFVSANCNTNTYSQNIYTWHENHLLTFAELHQMHIVVASASTDMIGGTVNHMQAPSGIIGPNGTWLAKCNDEGMDSVTMELDL